MMNFFAAIVACLIFLITGPGSLKATLWSICYGTTNGVRNAFNRTIYADIFGTKHLGKV